MVAPQFYLNMKHYGYFSVLIRIWLNVCEANKLYNTAILTTNVLFI